MNHTKDTLVIVGIAVSMIAAATIVALSSSSSTEQLAFAKKSKSVKVGNTTNKCKAAADNSQHVAFGPGSIGNVAANIGTNIQLQTCNVGSTGAG